MVDDESFVNDLDQFKHQLWVHSFELIHEVFELSAYSDLTRLIGTVLKVVPNVAYQFQLFRVFLLIIRDILDLLQVVVYQRRILFNHFIYFESQQTIVEFVLVDLLNSQIDRLENNQHKEDVIVWKQFKAEAEEVKQRKNQDVYSDHSIEQWNVLLIERHID